MAGHPPLRNAYRALLGAAAAMADPGDTTRVPPATADNRGPSRSARANDRLSAPTATSALFLPYGSGILADVLRVLGRGFAELRGAVGAEVA